MTETTSIDWHTFTPIQRDAAIAEHIMGWRWLHFDFYDVSSIAHQLWLLPDAMATQDVRAGEWTWYLNEEEVYPSGSLFPLPHKDNRILPTWIPHYTRSMSAAWQIVQAVMEPPHTPEDAQRAANTRFGYWWDKARLWAESEADAARAICINALKAKGFEVLI